MADYWDFLLASAGVAIVLAILYFSADHFGFKRISKVIESLVDTLTSFP